MSSIRGALALALAAAGGCVMAPDDPDDGASDAVAGGPGLGLGPLPGQTVQAVYLVADGETLGAIARRFAVPGGWRALAAANQLDDPDRVRAGAGLIIPTDGLIAAGREPFSVIDELDLLPRWAPIALTEAEVAPPSARDEPDPGPAPDHPDTCGGRHLHIDALPGSYLDLVVADDGEVREEPRPRCARLDRSTLCATPVVDDLAHDDGTIELTVDGAPWLRVPPSFHEPLEIVEVDLDGDGRREVIASVLVAVSNGAAIATYELAVAAGPGAPPHRFTTSGWRLTATADGCALEHQTFEGIDDPVDGFGNYDVTRELIWRGGALATRGGAIRADRWSSQPPQRRAEPLLTAPILNRRAGTVIDFDDRPDGPRTLVLDVDGQRLALDQRTWRWTDDEADPDPEAQYAGLGWAGEQVLLPDGYLPPAATLLGRAATVETRLALPEGELSQVVWLAP